VKGYGFREPRADNKTKAGRGLNRRTELKPIRP
jgi:outer membrane protein OmpA-like peptidoglycan-associated protein